MAELVSIKRNVDVSPGQAAPAVFHCSQGDVGSKIILGLLNNGTAYSIPSGVTVTIEGSESNGSIFTPISATVSGSDITFYLTGEMTAVAGPAICQAVLKSGSNILGTANFTLEVESSPMGADAPPVFTDAGWTWMLNKLNTEFVPALGNETIIDAIDSKADQSDLTALSNTVAGHTGSITVLNNTVNTLNHDVRENRQNIALKLDKNQGTANAGKYLKVQSTGQVVPVDLIDDSLLVETMAADAKATGVAISKKLNKYFGQAEAGKYLKVGTSGYVDSADLDVTTDKTLSITDKAADAKAVGDEITNLKADLRKKSGLTEDVKVALLACFEKVAWIDEDGQDYYDALYDALYPPADLVSISAVYTQSGTVYNTDTLDSLKTDLVVTAHFSDSSTQTITTYALSGTLTEGTSTITVTYSGKTTTFNVTVSEYVILYPLENGTHTFTSNNRTLTVSNGNHVEFDSSNYHTSGAYLNVSNVSDNNTSGTGASNVNNHATIFTIPSGSDVRFVVKNITASATATNIDIAFALRSGSSSAISSGNQRASSGTADALVFNDVEIETTASADIAVGCVFVYATFETSTISADIELYVNNERWI